MLWAHLRLCHCVFFLSVRVTIMYGVNSCRHPQHAELIVTWVCVHVQCGLFMCEQLRDNGSSTNLAQRRRTIVPFDGVCLWWWGDRKWDHAEGSVCARSLSKSGARPGGEYESLISRPRWAYGNEEQFIQCDVSKKGGICGYTRQCHFSPAFSLSQSSPSSHSLNSTLLKLSYCYKALWNSSYQSDHLSQLNSPFPHT